MKPVLTFVIPAYGDSVYLNNCLEALRAQKEPAEILIATSTPSVFINETAKKYHVPVFVNKEKKGIANDWNFACECCRTRYLTLAHQDDIYLPEYSVKCLQAMENHPESLMAFTDYREITGNQIRSNTILLNVKRSLLLPFFIFKSKISARLFKTAILSAGSAICCPSVMFNTETIGRIEFNRKMSINMDWDFWLKLAARRGSFHYIGEKLMLHRIHSGSETTKGLSSNRRQTEDRYMFEKIWPEPLAGIIAKLYSLSYLSNKEK